MFEESRAAHSATGLPQREAELVREVRQQNNTRARVDILKESDKSGTALRTPEDQQIIRDLPPKLCNWKHQLYRRISPEVLKQRLKVKIMRMK